MIKNKIRDLTPPKIYSLASNILRSTIFPYKLDKKKYFYLNENIFHPEITIDTIGLCNARCKFCAYRLGNRPAKFIKFDIFKDWADQAISLGFTRLNLTPLNGEFFLNKDHEKIINYSRKIGFKKVRTFSNGISLSKVNLSNVLDAKNGLTSLSISTGGFEKKTYEECFGIKKYDQFINSMNYLLDFYRVHKIKVPLSIELRSNKTFKENINYKDFKKYFHNDWKNNLFELDFISSFDDWSGQIDQTDLPEKMQIGVKPVLQTHPCHRLFTLGILYDGAVRLCNCRYQSGPIESDGLYIGNIFDTLLENILESNEIAKIRKDFSKNTPEVCKKCIFYIPSKFKS
jgi:MoaA/NifB/PqqE/SkfB family radical SAM enzyme